MHLGSNDQGIAFVIDFWKRNEHVNRTQAIRSVGLAVGLASSMKSKMNATHGIEPRARS